MPQSFRLAWLFVVCTGLVSMALFAPAEAQVKSNAALKDEFFKSGTVLKLSIDIAPKQLDALRREPRKYATATLKEGDKNVYTDVAVHVKGAAGSFRGIDDKPGLTLNMDKFNEGQHFHGLDKFHLANSVQDPSYVAELICGEMFRSVGIPAARVGHASVTINGRPRGFYYLKEGYDKAFIKDHFKDVTGNFYDGGFCRELDQPLQLLSGSEAAKNHADLKALWTAVNEANPTVRFQKLEKVLDMKKFITYLAMESFTWDWDGYPMNRNNYRLYHDPKQDKFVFIPSGMDQMFQNPGGALLPDFQGALARRLMETTEGKKLFYDRLAELSKTALRPEVIGKRLDEIQAKLQPAVAAMDPNLGRDLPNQINNLKERIRQRSKHIEDGLKNMKK